MNGANLKASKTKGPSDYDLANYARVYMSSYLVTVEREAPEHIPPFARNQPYNIEVGMMPNGAFVLLFEKSDKMTISVAEQTWDYVISKAMSGVVNLVAVYPHEGFSMVDATNRGERDAIRDICAMQNSDLISSVTQLEKLIHELSDVASWDNNPIKMAKDLSAKLEPIKEKVGRAGPNQDMLWMLEGVKGFPPAPTQVVLGEEGLKTLSSIARDLDSIEASIKGFQTQEERITALETALKQELSEFKSALDKKMAKGLSVMLQNADRKIDKAFEAFRKREGAELPPERDPRLDKLVEDFEDMKRQLSDVISRVSMPPEPDPRVARLEVELESVKEHLKQLDEEERIIETEPDPRVEMLIAENSNIKKQLVALTSVKPPEQRPDPRIDAIIADLTEVRRQFHAFASQPTTIVPPDPRIDALANDVVALRQQLSVLVARQQPQEPRPDPRMEKVLRDMAELQRKIDVLASAPVPEAEPDPRIDKVITDLRQLKEEFEARSRLASMEPSPDPRIDKLAADIPAIRKQLAEVVETISEELKMRPAEAKVPTELIQRVNELMMEISKTTSRVKRIEDYLIRVSASSKQRH